MTPRELAEIVQREYWNSTDTSKRIAWYVERAIVAAVEAEREAIRLLVSTLRDHAGDSPDKHDRDACTYIRGTCDVIDAAIRARGAK